MEVGDSNSLRPTIYFQSIFPLKYSLFLILFYVHKFLLLASASIRFSSFSLLKSVNWHLSLSLLIDV